jgi:hypothetical protein
MDIMFGTLLVLRTLSIDPTATLSRTDVSDNARNAPTQDIPLAKRTQERNEQLEPNCTKSSTEQPTLTFTRPRTETELPMKSVSNKLQAPTNCIQPLPAVDKLDPNLVVVRTLRVELRLENCKIEQDPAHLPKERSDTDEPTCTACTTLKVLIEPAAIFPKMLNDDPQRKQLRNEIDDPICTKLRTEAVYPEQIADLRLIEDPMITKSKTDAAEAILEKERNEREDPRVVDKSMLRPFRQRTR